MARHNRSTVRTAKRRIAQQSKAKTGQNRSGKGKQVNRQTRTERLLSDD
jgi:hypothetical protein